MKNFALTIAFFCLVLASYSSKALVDIAQFDSTQQEQQYKQLIDELRCVVCQNQNLADSSAPLAQDLRSITADMVRQGRSKQEIKDFMVQRYGEFVLYRPPLNAATGILWLAPFLVLAFTLIMAIRFILMRQKQATTLATELSEARRKEVQALLASDDKAAFTSEADSNA